MRCIVVLPIVLLMGACSGGQNPQPANAPSTAAKLSWKASDVPGLEMAVVSGDPDGNGPVVMRLRAQKEVRIPPHRHATNEHLRVITGTVAVGMGGREVASEMHEVQPGKDVLLPKGSPHYGVFEAGSEVEVRADGPFKMQWVDPAAAKAKQKDVDSNSERSKMKAEQEKQ